MSDNITFKSGQSENPLAAFAELPRWLAFTGKPKDDGRIDKAPKNPATGGNALLDNPATWGTRAEAERRAGKWASPQNRPGVGIALGDLGDGTFLCGVDLDGCLGPDGTAEPWAASILDRLDSYAEVSPSRKGVKAFFRVAAGDVPALRKAMGTEHRRAFKSGPHKGAEVHLSNTYYTHTGAAHGGRKDALRLVPAADLLWLVQDAGPAIVLSPEAAGDAPQRPASVTRDASRSAAALRLLLALFRAGATEEEARADIAQDRGAAGDWYQTTDDRQRDRAVAKAIALAAQERDELLADFDQCAEILAREAKLAAMFPDLFGELEEAPPAATAKPSGLRFLSPDECRESVPAPYIVKGLVARNNVVTIVGAPGVGKSALAVYLAYRVAQGQPVFGMRTRAGKVFYAVTENESDMKKRVGLLRDRDGPAPDFRLVTGGAGRFADAEFVARFGAAVRAERPALIVLDTLAAAFPGIEENSSEGMGAVLALAQTLVRTGAAVMLVHHDTKAGDGLPRGHSVLHGAVDMNLALRRAPDGTIQGVPSKNKNGRSHETLLAYRNVAKSLGTDEDGDPITAVICAEDVPSDAPPVVPLSAQQRAAMDLLHQLRDGRQSVTVDDWRRACIASPAVSTAETEKDRGRVFRAIVQKLAQKKLIVGDGESYSLPAQPHEHFADEDFPDEGEPE